MAVQLSHPQGAYVCGFCTFTSPDYKVLVKHLVDHTVFKEKKHEHILWCGLCKPLTGANHMDGQQQAMTSEDHLNGSTYHDNNDLDYGDMSNYSEYNGLYNPYAFPNAYYYPMNVAYSNPCYVNGYYQSEGTTFYTNNFYNGADVFPTVNTPSFIESAPENKNLLDSPHSSENIKDADSCSTKSLNDMTLPDFEDRSKGSNSVNYDSGIETLSVDPQSFPTENSSNKSDYKEFSTGETGTISKSTANSDLNVVRTNEFATISNIKPPAAEVESSIQPTSDKTLSRKLNSSQPNKVSSKEIPNPKRNAVKRNLPQTNIHRANDGETVPKDLTESSNFDFLSETGSKCVGSTIVDTKSAIKDSISMNANPCRAISAPNSQGCNSKLPAVKIAEPHKNDASKASSTDEQTPVSYPEAAHIKEIIINDASDVKNYSISVKVDTLSKNALRKESNSHLRTSERGASSENFLGKGSILAQDMNVSSVSDAKSSPKVYTAVLTDDTLEVETGSIDVNCPRTKIDLNGIHSEYPTGKLENLPKTNNSISVSKKDGLVSAAKFSPKINVSVTVRESSVSDIQIKSVGMKDDRRPKKNSVLGNKQKMPSERDGRMQLKSKTREYVLNRNSHLESKINYSEAITKSSKKYQSDETEALSNVRNSVRNSCQSDLNYTNRNCRPVPTQGQFKITYAELVRRWKIKENGQNSSST